MLSNRILTKTGSLKGSKPLWFSKHTPSVPNYSSWTRTSASLPRCHDRRQNIGEKAQSRVGTALWRKRRTNSKEEETLESTQTKTPFEPKSSLLWWSLGLGFGFVQGMAFGGGKDVAWNTLFVEWWRNVVFCGGVQYSMFWFAGWGNYSFIHGCEINIHTSFNF